MRSSSALPASKQSSPVRRRCRFESGAGRKGIPGPKIRRRKGEDMTQQYTVVQHSDFAWGHNPQFEKGLESQIVTPAQAEVVKSIGGALFDDYVEAEQACQKWAYPESTEGLIPEAPGTFSTEEIDGLPIYIPPVSLIEHDDMVLTVLKT